MIQKFFFGLLRGYVKLGLIFYFKEVRVVGLEKIPKGAVIYTPNHQNAFMDALLLICFTNRRIHSLVRASVFRNRVAKKLLNWLYMMPIFRIRDGFASLSGNDKIFDECYALLNQKESLLVFPEGNHNARRQMPPLSKGFARIAFGALDNGAWKNTLYVQPVSINYSNHTSSGSRVSIRFANPIPVHSLKEDYAENPQRIIKALKQELSDRMEAELVIIPEPYLKNALKLKNAFGDEITDPLQAKQFFQRQNFSTARPKPSVILLWISQAGYLINSIPITLLKKIIRHYVPDPMFHASCKLAFGIFLFPAIYAVEALIITSIFGINPLWVWGLSMVGILMRNRFRRIQKHHEEIVSSPAFSQN